MSASPRRSAPFFVAFATSEDSEDIRRLIADNDMDGWVRLSLERRGELFDSARLFADEHRFVLVRDAETGHAIAVGERSVRQRYVGGLPVPVPYFSGLRVDRRHRGRISVLRQGFALVRGEPHPADELPAFLTAIASDNHAARRLLEAGVRGLPTYAPMGELVTLALAPRFWSRPDKRIRIATAADRPAILACLDAVNRTRPFAPVWTDRLWQSCSQARVAEPVFLVLEDAGAMLGCIAVWNQSAVKRTVVSGYAPALGFARPLLNAARVITRLPHLPPPGTPLNQVFLSHLAVVDATNSGNSALIGAALDLAALQGFSAALLGMPACDPVLGAIRTRYGGLVYRSRLYLVHWPEDRDRIAPHLASTPFPDIATL